MPLNILLLGDLHGRLPKIHFDNYDMILTTGDFCYNDEISPFIMKAIGKQEKGEKKEWYDIIGRREAKKMMDRSILGMKETLEKLDSIGKPVFVVPGNWENMEYSKNIFRDIMKTMTNVENIHGKRIDIGDYELIGYGFSSGPEDPSKVGYSFSKYEMDIMAKNYFYTWGKFSDIFSSAKKPVIFLSHNVPYDTTLDIINNKDSSLNGMHYGSTITREMIENYHPIFCGAGHIHENRGKCLLGSTLVINAGYGPDANTLIEIDGKGVRDVKFYRK